MLAIVIPYYKINYFEETLESLSKQTDKRFKVYIGNDASSENPESILKSFVGHFNYEYFEFQKNLGGEYLTKQWERCIDLTKEETWVMILGDDDKLGENVVEEFYHCLNENEFDSNIIRCATIVIDEQKNYQSDLSVHPILETGIEFSIRKLRGETRSSLSEYFFKKEIYLKYKFTHFPSAFYSDDKAWLDFSEDKLIFSINRAVVYIRISDFSLSGSATNKVSRKAECLYLINLYRKNFKELKKDQKVFLLNKLEDTFYFNKIKQGKLLFWLYFQCFRYFEFNRLVRFHKKLLRKIYHFI